MNQPPEPRRVVVVGNTAAGKSTLSARLAQRYDLAHLELDAFTHQGGWRLAGPEAFRADVAARMTDRGWVADGNWLSYTTDGSAPALVAFSGCGSTAGRS